MLESSCCRNRQRRVVAIMERMDVDQVLLTRPEHVQYLTGFRPHRLMSAAVILGRDGHCTLVAPNQTPEAAAADEFLVFPAQFRATLRQDQLRAIGEAIEASPILRAEAGSRRCRIGIEYSQAAEYPRQALASGKQAEWIDVESELWNLRRRKDRDELALIRRAIDCTHSMYQRAREILRPGISELDVYGALHAAAVGQAGEPLLDLGNDFQCNSPGGPPRARGAGAGELYILDLGVSYRGYYSDNCRTFAIGQPTDLQLQAWQAVVAVLEMVERTVRPGVRCRDLFCEAQAMLDAVRPDAFFHHLGHGIGLYPHEAPHLNPHWDDVFQEGEVFTAEPGLYWPELRAGIRIEDDYLVTAQGVERLTNFPRELMA